MIRCRRARVGRRRLSKSVGPPEPTAVDRGLLRQDTGDGDRLTSSARSSPQDWSSRETCQELMPIVAVEQRRANRTLAQFLAKGRVVARGNALFDYSEDNGRSWFAETIWHYSSGRRNTIAART